MKRGFSVLAVLCLQAGCQQVENIQEDIVAEEPPEEIEAPEEPETKPEPEAPPIEPEKPATEPEKPAPKPVPQIPAGPVQPKETPALLRIVNNWRAIPRSAFPRQVSVKRPVSFTIRDASGNKVGGSNFPRGAKVVAFEQVGPMISVGPSGTSPMRTMVGLNDTDLKQVLIYAYELNKRRQTEVSMVRPRPTQRPPTNIRRPTPPKRPPASTASKPPTRPKPTPKPAPKPTRNPKPENEAGPLFEDVPEAKVVNPKHGKWCVCRDCRKLRGIGR